MTFKQWIESQEYTVQKYQLDFQQFWIDCELAYLKGITGTRYDPVEFPLVGFDEEFKSCRTAAIVWVQNGYLE